MLHLHFGNRLEPLADALAGELDRTWTDPLDPPPVAVPSPSVGRWLKLRLAARGRTVLNLATTTLESLLWKTLEPAAGDRILRVDALQHAVCRLLDQRLLAGPDFADLRRFLSDGDGIDAVRRTQIARETARLFLEYEYNRPSVWRGGRWAVEGIDRAWPRRPYFDSGSESAVELWQRRLHGLVFADDGPLADTGFLGLPRLHRLRRDAGWTGAGGPIFLLSVDKTSHFHRNLLLELSEAREVHLFLVNPCMEFWEDVDTSRSRKRGAGRIPLRHLTSEEYGAEDLPSGFWKELADPPLLRLWGRTARENTVLWCQAADHEFEDHSVEPAEGGLLGALQLALLRRDAGPLRRDPPGAALPDDGSLRVLAAPEPQRELEAVRDAVFQWLSEDASRRPSDVAVLLPDPQARSAGIEAVFGARPSGDPGRIPYAVVGASGEGSGWAAGAGLLLRAWTEGLDREVVLGLAANELVRRRRGWTDSDTLSWPRWTAGSGMLRGWDAADRIARGESGRFATDRHTLKAGLVRLSLSALASHPVRAGLEEGEGGDGTPPWRDSESGDLDELDLFAGFLDDLHRDLEAPPAGSLAEQGRRFLSLCDAWMDPSADASDDALRRSVAEGIADFHLRGGDPADPAELAECLRPLLEQEVPATGSAWTGALTFAPLRPGHILPHGLVVVAGLDESFPGEIRTAILDLLSRRRIVGDPDGVAENRHAFLLALLSARSRLVLSWTSRDLRKDVVRPPSSVLLELESALREGFLAEPSGRRGVRRAIPLLARNGGVLEGDPPAWDVPSWDPDDAPRGLRLRDDPPAAAPEDPSLDDLESFLRSPRLHRVGARIRREDDDTETRSPLAPDLPRLHGLCTGALDVLWRAGRIGGPDAPEGREIARRVVEASAWDEGIPEGDFLAAATARLGEWIEAVRSGLAGLAGGDMPLHWQAAPAEILRRAGARIPAGLPTARWRWAAGGPAPGRWVLVDLVAFEGRSAKPEKKARAYLAGAWLRAAGWTDPVDILWVERMKEGRVAPETLPAEADGKWLSDLLADCRNPSRTEHVPLHAAVGKTTTRESMESRMEDPNRHRPELERLLEPALPDIPEPDLAALVERWFRPWRNP